MSKRVQASAVHTKATVHSPRVLMRNYFSTNFLWTALHLSRLVDELESAAGRRPRFDMAHRSYAASSIIASTTFLEAAISELFQDAVDGHGINADGYLAPLSRDAIGNLADTWRQTDYGREIKTVEKWQRFLECCGRDRLAAGAAPVQDATLLTQLRNALVHFKPEDIAADEAHKLERQLKGKFRDNRLMEDGGNPWWPDHCLGHGCTLWAVRAARQLSDHVLGKVGISPNYQRIEAAGWNGTTPQPPTAEE